MPLPAAAAFRIGAWRVNPASGEMSRNGETVRVEVRTLRLLMCLAEHDGQVVSIDDLLTHVWSGVIVSPDSVYQAVASLRRALGDDPKQPTYIETVPRLGYRMVAPVGPWIEPPLAHADAIADAPAVVSPPPRPRVVPAVQWAAVAAFGAAIVVALLLGGAAGRHSSGSPATAQPERSIAVLPFLDLTDEQMSHETLADGMTEELIGRLSKIPGLRIPAPTSSFYFKGKKVPVADIARKLGVAYVLDGSLRQAGAKLRIAARLIRADSGYVIWSGTYDRPFDDVLKVQDDIAGEVTKALRPSLD